METLPPGVQLLEASRAASERPTDAVDAVRCPATLRKCDSEACWRSGDERGRSFCARLQRVQADTQLGGPGWVDRF